MIKDLIHLFTLFRKERPVYSVLYGILLIVLTIVSVLLDLRFNVWRQAFWTAVSTKSMVIIYHQVWVFIVLAGIAVGIYTFSNYIGQRYCLEWRASLTNSLVTRWISKLTTGKQNNIPLDNVDQRIQSDAADFLTLFNQLFLGLLSSILTLILFVPMLGHLGSQLMPLWGLNGVIWLPMVCIILSVLGFCITSWLGRVIPTLQNGNQQSEANYRYQLVTIRDGKPADPVVTAGLWTTLWTNHIILFKKARNFSAAANFFSQALIIVPIFCVLPSFLSGLVALGVIMATLDCFNKISDAANFYLNNFLTVCSFRATMNRLTVLDKQLGEE